MYVVYDGTLEYESHDKTRYVKKNLRIIHVLMKREEEAMTTLQDFHSLREALVAWSPAVRPRP